MPRAAEALMLVDRPRVAMAILRHSSIALTMEIYSEVPDQATRDVLGRLSGWLDEQLVNEELAADLADQDQTNSVRAGAQLMRLPRRRSVVRGPRGR
jgi:hypothetical protein